VCPRIDLEYSWSDFEQMSAGVVGLPHLLRRIDHVDQKKITVITVHLIGMWKTFCGIYQKIFQIVNVAFTVIRSVIDILKCLQVAEIVWTIPIDYDGMHQVAQYWLDLVREEGGLLFTPKNLAILQYEKPPAYKHFLMIGSLMEPKPLSTVR